MSRKDEEDAALQVRLRDAGQGIVQIPADGDCMYSAVAHQLGRLLAAPWGLPLSSSTTQTLVEWLAGRSLAEVGAVGSGLDALPLDVVGLRAAAAYHMLSHRADFEPFVTLGEGEDYAAFCERIKTTHEWGRQLELRALADCLRVQILVYSADQAPLPMKALEVVGEPVLRISYHKHQYTLGEHYNSVVPGSEVPPTRTGSGEWTVAGTPQKPEKLSTPALNTNMEGSAKTLSPRSQEMLAGSRGAADSTGKQRQKIEMSMEGISAKPKVIVAKGPSKKGGFKLKR